MPAMLSRIACRIGPATWPLSSRVNRTQALTVRLPSKVPQVPHDGSILAVIDVWLCAPQAQTSTCQLVSPTPGQNTVKLLALRILSARRMTGTVAVPEELKTPSARRSTTVSVVPAIPAGAVTSGTPVNRIDPENADEPVQKKSAGIGLLVKSARVPPDVVKMSTPPAMVAGAAAPAGIANRMPRTIPQQTCLQVIVPMKLSYLAHLRRRNAALRFSGGPGWTVHRPGAPSAFVI